MQNNVPESESPGIDLLGDSVPQPIGKKGFRRLRRNRGIKVRPSRMPAREYTR